ncbi:MAG: rod shape-determining protein RodA [Bacteroidetes bacterium]|nr:rod shape-determining protein RodA [Bacteroidota bacterium]
MKRPDSILANIDWLTILVFFLMVMLGWINLYAAVFDEKSQQNMFDLSQNSGKQLLYIISTIFLIIIIVSVDFKFYNSFAYIIYGFIIVLLISVLLFGKEVAGAKSWFDLGLFQFQPSEFSKFATALVVAKYLDNPSVKLTKIKNLFVLVLLVGLPMGLILLQPDTGTALVFMGFIIVFYREGLSSLFIILGLAGVAIFIMTLLIPQVYLFVGIVILGALIIGFGARNIKRIAITLVAMGVIAGTIKSVDFVINDVLKPHQQNRIKVLFNPDIDPLGAGWNVTQSKIAIGSGGLAGKGFLAGTQTKFDFVPEQSTDFIFCTIGEEHGWMGSLLLISLFTILLIRVINIAERQKSRFTRVYGYSVASIIFIHFMVNIGMTIGLFPVIGIPLPFFSYGGSSLWAFTVLLFILLKLDAHRMQILVW